MARWIFTRFPDPVGAELGRWTWELRNDDGSIMSRSAGAFSDFRICTEDASRHGYYVGHYDVTVHRADEQNAHAPAL